MEPLTILETITSLLRSELKSFGTASYGTLKSVICQRRLNLVDVEIRLSYVKIILRLLNLLFNNTF